MADTSRSSRTLVGCGLGCGGLLVVLIAGCFVFQTWLNRPGELLEPAALLDPSATTYVACRLDLAEASTRQFVEQMLAAARQPGEQLRGAHRSAVLDFLVGWNENRQRRDLLRMFPVTATWVVWPGEHDAASVGAVALSARGLSHKVMFMDWVLDLVGGHSSKLNSRIVAGERVYEVGRTEPLYAFLDRSGVILCLDLDSVAPAVERLRQQRAAAQASRTPTDLERRLAAVPKDLPLRGIVEGPGEVGQLLAWLAPKADREEWAPSWTPIEGATVGGRFTDRGGVALTIELAVAPATSAPQRERLLADLERYFGEQWPTQRAIVRTSSQGVTLDLLAEDLPRQFAEAQTRPWPPRGHGSATAPLKGSRASGR